MTTAYVVEVNTPSGIRYMANKGRLMTFPKLFTGHARVKALLTMNKFGYSPDYYFGEKAHRDATKIIRIDRLELGLKDSRATIFGFDEFIEKDFSRKASSIRSNMNAVYMIELAPNLALATSAAAPIYVQSVGGRKRKFGHQWNRAGDLRSHISSRIIRLFGQYKDAKVVEIEMSADGFTPKQVKTYPIVDFYCASESSLQKYTEACKQYDSLRKSFTKGA